MAEGTATTYRHVALAVGLVALATGTLAANVAPASAQQARGATGTLSGEILSAESGAPLASATVQVMGGERSAVTTEAGTFRFTDLPVGRHRLRIEYMGHTAEVTGILLEAEEV